MDRSNFVTAVVCSALPMRFQFPKKPESNSLACTLGLKSPHLLRCHPLRTVPFFTAIVSYFQVEARSFLGSSCRFAKKLEEYDKAWYKVTAVIPLILKGELFFPEN